MKLSYFLVSATALCIASSSAFAQVFGGEDAWIFISPTGQFSTTTDDVSLGTNASKDFVVTVIDWDLAQSTSGLQSSRLNTFVNLTGSRTSGLSMPPGVTVAFITQVSSSVSKLEVKFRVTTTNATAQTFDYLWTSTDLYDEVAKDSPSIKTQTITITQ